MAPIYCRRTDAGAVCAIRKDGGDDVDVTTGLPVIASVVLEPDAPGVRILGGEGVGRVTKPGLDQPVGEAAINHVPRQMIAEALEREAENAAYTGGFAVTISVEGGAETAKRTFNPHIGVEGGLSVLGQTMSMLSGTGIPAGYLVISKITHSLFAAAAAFLICGAVL